jgi:hypothetical protein
MQTPIEIRGTAPVVGDATCRPRDVPIPPGRPARRRSKLLGALGGLLVTGALIAGCGGAGTAGASRAGSDRLVSNTRHDAGTSATTPTSLPACGSNRDPFDPTGSAPPPGSPAIC